MSVNQSLLVRCVQCGANNRVAADRVSGGAAAVCGRCKTPLPSAEPNSGGAADGTIVTVTDATFEDVVGRSPLPVLLDLWAPWCGPCRMLTPTLEKLAAEFAGRVRVAKVNVDENSNLAQRFQAMSIPLLVILKDGQEVDRMVGLQPATAIWQRLNRAASA